MLNRFKASLSQPKSLFSYKDDRKRIVFLYSLIMICLSMVPYIILEATQGNFDASMMVAIEDAFQQDVMQKDNQIIDGVLLTNEPFETMVDFNVFTNDITVNTFYLVIFFDETHLQLKLGDEIIEEVSYQTVLPNFDFMDYSLENTSQLMSVIASFLNESAFVSVLMLGSIFFSLTLDYLMITFLLVLLMQMNRQANPLPFKTKYKLGLYMSTPYMLTSLILVLFGFGQLSYISLLVAYIYYMWAYRLSGGKHA